MCCAQVTHMNEPVTVFKYTVESFTPFQYGAITDTNITLIDSFLFIGIVGLEYSIPRQSISYLSHHY